MSPRERRAIVLGCAALAAIGLVVALGVAAALSLLRGAVGGGSGHEIVIAARSSAGSIEVSESELCPVLERAIPPERASFSEATEAGCTVHVLVWPEDAMDLAQRVRGALAAERFEGPPSIQRVEPGRPIWVIADGAPRDGARVLDDLRRDLEALSGVSSVAICGPEPATAVRLDPSAIAARALAVGDVIAALSGELPGGRALAVDDRAPRVDTVRVDTMRRSSLAERPIAPGISLRDVASIVETSLPRECDAALAGEAVAAMRVEVSPWDAARTFDTVRAVVGDRARMLEPVRTLRVAAPDEIDALRLSEVTGGLVYRDEHGGGIVLGERDAGDSGLEDRIAQLPGIAVVDAGHHVARLWAARDADVVEIARRARELDLVVAPLAHPERPEIAVTIDRERTAALGVAPEEIASSISAWRGVELRDEDDRRVQVRLDLPETTQGLAEIVVPTRDRGAVRIVEVVTIAARAPEAPRHRRRGAPVVGLLVSSRTPGADRAALARALDGLDLEVELL